MEKRIAVVTVLSIIVLLGWSYLVAPLLSPPPKPKAKATADVEPSWADVRAPEPSAPTPAPPPAFVPEQGEEKVEVLESETVRARLTSRGGALLSLDTKFGDAWHPLLGDNGQRHFVLASEGQPELSEGLWEARREGDTVTFLRQLSGGLSVERVWAVDARRNRLAMRTVVTNPSGAPKKLPLTLQAINGLPHDSDYRFDSYARGFWGLKRGSGASITFTNLPEIEKKKLVSARADEQDPEYLLDAVGLLNRYFTVTLLPEGDATRKSVEAYQFTPRPAGANPDGRPRINAAVKLHDLSVTQREHIDWTVFAGPLDDALLEEVKYGLPALHDYGAGCFLFGWIVQYVAPLLLFVMRMWNSLFGNWGVAIIMTTITLRLGVFWLSRKAQVSMARMSELGPKIQLIRERYPDDPRKAQAEMMKVWREHGVSPLSGCLPMLLQLPIWISMYSVVDMALELRQAPFMFWIDDLSAPDRLVHFTKEISFLLFSIDAINVLPVIMTITWFLQAYFAPRSPDPQMQMQQKMMLFMPVVFGLMCYNLASGLSLYFFVNSLLSMIEQKIIKKVWIEPMKKAAQQGGSKP